MPVVSTVIGGALSIDDEEPDAIALRMCVERAP